MNGGPGLFDQPDPGRPPGTLARGEEITLREAARRAARVLPPGLASLVARELLYGAELGVALPSTATQLQAAREILTLPALTDSRRTYSAGE